MNKWERLRIKWKNKKSRRTAKAFINRQEKKIRGKKAAKSHKMAKWLIRVTCLEEKILRDKRAEKLERIYLTRNKEVILQHWYQRVETAYKVFFVFLFTGIVLLVTKYGADSALIGGNRLKRPEYDGISRTYDFAVSSGKEGSEKLSVTVSPRAYTESQWEEISESGIQYLSGHFLGENSSKNEITQKLYLPTRIPDTAIQVEWRVEPAEYIAQDGTIRNESLDSREEVRLSAVLTYGEWEKRWEEDITVCPRQRTPQEAFWKDVSEKIKEAENRSAEKPYLVLPEEVQGKKISYQENSYPAGGIVIVTGIIMAILLFLREGTEVDKKDEKRKWEINAVYPLLVNKFILLMGAGMTVKAAWGKIVADYQDRKMREGIRQYAYEEMTIAWKEIANGISEAKAYEAFGKRMGTTAYLKFSTLLSQNLRKGSRGLLALLEVEGVSAWEDKKELVKRKGEEAGTRLLMPMMLMFLLVMVIILAPAMSAF